MGLNKSEITATPYEDVVGKPKKIDLRLLELAKSLER
jgi:hypothetical protein